MDTLTHMLSGAMAARAVTPDRPAPGTMPVGQRMFVGAVAAGFPDLDIVLRLVDPLFYLLHHRGVTHSVLLAPLWAVLVGWALWRLHRRQYPWRAYFALCLLSIGVHILGDFITLYGTQILAPLTSRTFAYPTTFIIDPYLSCVLVLGTWFGLRAARGRRAALGAWVVVLAYVGMQSWALERAGALADAYRIAYASDGAEAHAMPQPFSPFHWRLLVVDGDTYHLADVSFVRSRVMTAPLGVHPLARLYLSYRPVEEPGWRRRERFGGGAEQAFVAEAWSSEAMADYRRFARFPILLAVTDGERQCAWFADLRFALEGLRFPFIHGACREGIGPWILQPDGEEVARSDAVFTRL
jgi:inner membrane protein